MFIRLKKVDETLKDIEAKTREFDSDRSIQFEYKSKEKKLHELIDDCVELSKVKGLNNKIWIFLFGNVKININV